MFALFPVLYSGKTRGNAAKTEASILALSIVNICGSINVIFFPFLQLKIVA